MSEEDGVQELIALLKEDGQWVEPPCPCSSYFNVRAPIGEGASGKVFVARDRRSGMWTCLRPSSVYIKKRAKATSSKAVRCAAQPIFKY